MNKLPERDIENLWKKYENLLGFLEEEGVNNLLEENGQRIIECSYSQRTTEVFCGIGGLVEYSLELAKTSKELSKSLNYCVEPKQIIKIALLSEIGRIGTLHCDRFKISDSEWHKEKLGQYYDWNESCEKYNIYHMTLFYLQRYNIFLTWEEMQAILLLEGITSETSKFYSEYKSQLTLLMQISKEVVIKKQKEIINGTHKVPF
jgi:hypothetical protein